MFGQVTAAALICVAAVAFGVSASKHADWAEHDLTIELEHLPRQYLCSELNYKVHDILAAIGARADMRVEASRCRQDIDFRQIAPWVHMTFSLPYEVDGQLAKSADMFATERTVRIEPGNPPAIDSGDCQLLRQLERTLFVEVPIPVEADHLGCQSSATLHQPFSLTLDVLIPATEPSKAIWPRSATRTPPLRRGSAG